MASIGGTIDLKLGFSPKTATVTSQCIGNPMGMVANEYLMFSCSDEFVPISHPNDLHRRCLKHGEFL